MAEQEQKIDLSFMEKGQGQSAEAPKVDLSFMEKKEKEPTAITKQPLVWPWKYKRGSVFEKAHPLQGPANLVTGFGGEAVNAAVIKPAEMLRDLFLVANEQPPMDPKYSMKVPDIEAPPGWGVGQVLGEGAGHFYGFAKGLPGAVMGKVASPVTSYVFKRLAPEWGPEAAEFVSKIIGESAGMSAGMGAAGGETQTPQDPSFLDKTLENLATMQGVPPTLGKLGPSDKSPKTQGELMAQIAAITERMKSGAILGAIFGGTKFVSFPKFAPFTNTLIRQAGSRTLAGLAGQYKPELFKQLISGDVSPETAQSVFDEFLFTAFSRGAKADPLRVRNDIARIKDELARSGAQVEVKPEIEKMLVYNYSKNIYEEQAVPPEALIRPPSAEASPEELAPGVARRSITKPPEIVNEGELANKMQGEAPPKKPQPTTLEYLQSKATDAPPTAEMDRPEVEMPRSITQLSEVLTEAEKAKRAERSKMIRILRKEPWERMPEEEEVARATGVKDAQEAKNHYLYAGLHPRVAKEFIQKWAKSLSEQGLLDSDRFRIFDKAIEEVNGGPLTKTGSILRRNADAYRFAVDPDKLCPRSQKQRNTQAIIETSIGRDMKADEVADLRQFMKDAGEIVACPQCYTESHRIQGYSAAALDPQGNYREGDLIKSSKRNPSDFAFIRQHTGLRSFANTDFKPQFIPDLMRIYKDGAELGLHGNTYTKQMDYVDIFAPTRIKINISLGGDVVNGKLVENLDIGAPWDAALKRRQKYSNVGTVLVAKTDSEIFAGLKDKRVDHVLPMHHSGIPKSVRERWGALNDYTAVQSESWLPGVDKEAGRKAYKDLCEQLGITPEFKGAEEVPFITDWMHGGSKAKFLGLCETIGLKPRFSGSKTTPDFTKDPNYMKMVGPECGKFGDNTRVPIQANFDYQAAKRSMENWVAQGGIALESAYSTEAAKYFAEKLGPKTGQYAKMSAWAYQNENQERMVHEGKGWGGYGSQIRNVLEGTGDIFRELSKTGDDYADPGYIMEKVERAEKWLGRQGSVFEGESIKTAKEKYAQRFEEFRKLWEQQPTESKWQERAKELNLAILDGNLTRAKNILADIRAVATGKAQNHWTKFNDQSAQVLPTEQEVIPKKKTPYRPEEVNPLIEEGILKVYAGFHPEQAKDFIQKWAKSLSKEGKLGREESERDFAYYSQRTEDHINRTMTPPPAGKPKEMMDDMELRAHLFRLTERNLQEGKKGVIKGASIVGNLRRVGLTKLAQSMEDYEAERRGKEASAVRMAGKTFAAIVKNTPEYESKKLLILKSKDQAVGRRLKALMEGKAKPKTEAEEAALKINDALRRDIFKQATENGLEVTTPYGVEPLLKHEIENYFPHEFEPEGIKALYEGDILKLSAPTIYEHIAKHNPLLKPLYDDPLTRVEALEKAANLFTINRGDWKSKSFGHLEMPRFLTDELISKLKTEWEAKYPDKEFPLKMREDSGVWLNYLTRAYERISWVKNFGKDVHGAQPGMKGNTYPERMVEALMESSGEAKKYVQEAFDILLKAKPSNGLDKLIDTYRSIQSGKMLFSAIPNSTQWVNAVIMQPLSSTGKTFYDIFRYAGGKGKEEAETLRDFFYGSGAARMKADLQRMLTVDPDMFQTIRDIFMTANLFSATEYYDKLFSGMAGPRMAQTMSQRLYEGEQKGEGWKYRRRGFYIAELKKMGLTDELIKKITTNGPLTERQLLEHGRAAYEMSKLTQFMQSAFFYPLSWSTKWGKTLTQFKSFGYQQAKFVYNEPVKEFYKFFKTGISSKGGKEGAWEGDLTKAFRAMAFLPAAGAFVYHVRKQIYKWLGIPFYEAMLAGKSWPWKMAVYAWNAGGLGLMSDAVTAFSRGTSGLVSLFGGPTAGDIAQLGESGVAIFKELSTSFEHKNIEWVKQRNKTIAYQAAKLGGRVSPLLKTLMTGFWKEYRDVNNFNQWSGLIREGYRKYKETYVLDSREDADMFWDNFMESIGVEYEELTGKKLSKPTRKEIDSWWEEMGEAPSQRVPLPGKKPKGGYNNWVY